VADRAQSKALIGADYLYAPDQDWWNCFQYLSDAAHAIFLLPAARGGTFKEIMWLKDQNLLSQCVFVMPETISETGVHAGMKVSTALKIVEWHPVDHAREWTAAQEAILAEAKLLLPDYQAPGAVFTLDGNGRIRAQAPLRLGSAIFKIAKLRKAIKVVLVR